MNERSLYRTIMKLMYSLYQTTLAIVADSEISDHTEGGEDVDGSAEENGNGMMEINLPPDAEDMKEEEEEKGMRSLLCKGPVQAFSIHSSSSTSPSTNTSNDNNNDNDNDNNDDENDDETKITEADHIAKNKLDCRGHIIGKTTPEESLHLMRLMLSCWLNCKYAALAIAQLIVLLPDSCFEGSISHSQKREKKENDDDDDDDDVEKEEDVYLNDLRSIQSWFANTNISDMKNEYYDGDNGDTEMMKINAHLSKKDVVYIVWNLLVSVLTIKHIGGIVFVAESIAAIITRFTKMVGVNDFVASLPGVFVNVLLDEENINNRNFILRRSTGFSKAICSVCRLG